MANTSPTYNSYSLYYDTPVNSSGKLDLWSPRTIPAYDNDKYITISAAYNQRPDLLAYDLYSGISDLAADLWWVFAMRNPDLLASNPIGNFVPGLKIYIPAASTLTSALGI